MTKNFEYFFGDARLNTQQTPTAKSSHENGIREDGEPDMIQKLEIHIVLSTVLIAFIARVYPLSLSKGQPVSTGRVTKGAFIQRHFLNKSKRSPPRQKIPKNREEIGHHT